MHQVQDTFSPSPVIRPAFPVEELKSHVLVFDPIGLAEMDGVALLDRHDTKFVLSTAALTAILPWLAGGYRILEEAGRRVHRYETIYFDSAGFDLYHADHHARPGRVKVRSRRYCDSGLAFLEVKRKTKQHRTVKRRVRTPNLLYQLTPCVGDFVDEYGGIEAGRLIPRLRNTFSRLTFVSRHRSERLTIDCGLAFGAGEEIFDIPGLVIAEVKRDGTNGESDFVSAMRESRIRPGSFSKYCVGAALLYPELKHNRFNTELRLVKSLQEVRDVC